MSWSSKFLDALAAPGLVPSFLFETIYLAGMGVLGTWRVASREKLSGTPYLGSGLEVGGQIVQVQTWRSSLGAFTVRILSGATLQAMLQQVTRGCLCRVSMGFGSWDEGDYEPILLGQVRNVTGTSPVYEIQCNDLLSVLQSRLTTDSTKLGLFSAAFVPPTTVASSAYTAGDATIGVASTTGWTRETGGSYAIRVEPKSGKDPFYLTATGKTATSFTGLSVGGLVGSTPVKAKIGSVVNHVAYLTGDPSTVLRKVLESTGAGTNGTYDTYPLEWGFGLDKDLVDDDDIVAWKKAYDPPGAHTWDLVQEEGESDALGWLADHLADLGVWPVVRHGRLSIRVAQDPESSTVVRDAFEITDDMIASVDAWEAYDENVPMEYGRVRCTTGSGSGYTAETVGALPAAQEYAYDLGDKVWSNEAAVRTEVRARMAPWALRIPERLTLTLVGLPAMALVPGDLPTLSTSYASGRGETDAWGYDGRKCMVTEVSPDPMAGKVSVVLAIPPTWSGTFP